MTANQIAYMQLLESRRSNAAKEYETQRHNIVYEGETQRHNVATENISTLNFGETQRHNQATEGLSMQSIGIEAGKLAETQRTNLAREVETNRSNLASEAELYRSHTASEAEAQRSHIADESERYRHNTTQEMIDAAKNGTVLLNNILGSSGTSGVSGATKLLAYTGSKVAKEQLISAAYRNNTDLHTAMADVVSGSKAQKKAYLDHYGSYAYGVDAPQVLGYTIPLKILN